jgi:hypothetical protein
MEAKVRNWLKEENEKKKKNAQMGVPGGGAWKVIRNWSKKE